MTDLFQNAFYVLGATPRTTRAALVHLEEEAGLGGDAHSAAEARATLGSARSRLAAEIAWFPGVSPSQAADMLARIKGEPDQVYGDLGIPPLASANAIASALGLLDADDADDVLIACSYLAQSFSEIDTESLRRDINEDRHVAGFPLVAEGSLVADEIDARRRYYVKRMLDALDTLPTPGMVEVASSLASDATCEGERPADGLVDELIEAYALRAHAYISGEADGIKEIIRATSEASDQGADAGAIKMLVERIIVRIRKWDSVVQPIQLTKQGKGLPHEESVDLAMEARNLAVHLFNKHDYLETARAISTMLQEVFAEVPEVLERVEDDLEALEDIFDERQTRKQKSREDEIAFAKEITYETNIGLVFKDRLRISPQGFEWKGSVIPLDEITGISWGGIQNQYSTSYFIHLHAKNRAAMDVELNDSQKYNEITQRLWRAAGVRLMVEFLSALRNGGRFRFGTITVADDGVTLPIPRIFRADESTHLSWSEVRRSVGNGSVTFASKDNTARGGFDVRGTVNGPIVAACVDMFFKKGGSRISSLLGDGK